MTEQFVLIISIDAIVPKSVDNTLTSSVGYVMIVVAIAFVGGFGDGYRVSRATRQHMITAK